MILDFVLGALGTWGVVEVLQFGLYQISVGCGDEEKWADVKGISEEKLFELGTDFKQVGMKGVKCLG